MERSAILVLVVGASLAHAEAPKMPAHVFDGPAEPAARTAIDEAVLRKLKALKIEPARACSDSVFIRRAYLDVIGTLPTLEEVTAFLKDAGATKRSALIDRLLGRREFAVYWAMKWSDLLRVKAEFPINLWPNAAQAYYVWIWSSLKDNMPYDRFAREQLTASGSNFRVAPVNFYRAMQSKDPESITKTVALTFMGARADKWPRDRLAGMTPFFAYVGYKKTLEWKEEVVYFDTIKAARAEQARAGQARAGQARAGQARAEQAPPLRGVLPDGTVVHLGADKDPREVFANWLIAPGNEWFARNIANRAWAWLVGRGIIEEPDDNRPDNPPVNPELLALLEKELVASQYDLKHVYRLILNSGTYQLSSVADGNDPKAEANFARYPIRRLEAEVLIDALCQLTGTTESYSSRIPEPYTFIPETHRTIALPDGSITNSFLEMFGRSPRDTGLESERNNNPTAAQRLHMLNSSHILGKMDRGAKMKALMDSDEASPKGPVTRLYLAILSRYPTDGEVKRIEAYAQGEETKGHKALVDLAWALINSSEFLYRH
jgi:hypothetical protein